MLPESHCHIPLQTIYDPLFTEKNVSLTVLRTDLTDPVISGNKWFKLKYNLIEAREQVYTTLLSFGGPYSNHLHALASAGKAGGFNTIGIIRGEEHLPLNPTLSDLVAQGMKLYYVDRQTYRNKHTPEVIQQIRAMIEKDDKNKQTGEFYLVPEGGTNDLAIKGASEIASFIPADTDFVCVPCGTGGTAAGIINGLSHSEQHHPRVLGFPAMKGGQFLNQTITTLLSKQENAQNRVTWELLCDYHFGGFGKINQSLALFIRDFEKKHSIPLDPIYTAKMMYAIVSLIKEDFFPNGSKIVAIHTGGLQGRRGMEQKIQALISN